MKKNLLLFFAVWFVLILANLNYLDAPPYWDDLVGLHTQAMWHVNHNFNLWQLWQSPVKSGSSNLYPLGILPLLYGMLYQALPPVAVHIVGHLFNMACLAGCFVLCLNLVRRYQPWPVAVIAALTALADPITAGQSAALGQECPLALLTLLSLHSFFRHHHKTAYVWAVAAFLIKYTGILLLLAYAVYWSGILALNYWKRQRLGSCWRPWLWSAVVLLAGIAAMCLFKGTQEGAKENFSAILLMLRVVFFSWHYYPLLMLKVIVAMLALACLWRCRRNRIGLLRFPLLLVAIFCAGFCTAFFFHVLPLPRYFLTIIFPLSILLFAVIPPRAALWGGLLVIALQLANLNGAFYSPLRAMPRSGALLERSREYLADLDANRRLCRWLEENADNRPVIAKWPFTHMLTVPQFGYVTRPLQSVYCPYPVHDCARGVTVFGADLSRLPPDVLCLYADNDFEYMFRSVRLRPPPDAAIVYADEDDPRSLLIYQVPQRPAGAP